MAIFLWSCAAVFGFVFVLLISAVATYSVSISVNARRMARDPKYRLTLP